MGLFDDRGCLTRAGLEAIHRAPVGQAPPELAQHLAACRRCQYRLLSGGRTPPPPSAGRRRAPLAWRVAALGVAGLFLTLLALIATRWLLPV